MIKTNEIAYLAGLLEGEGYFAGLVRRRRKERMQPVIRIQMCDKDVLQKVADRYNRKLYGPYDYAYRHRQPAYEVRWGSKDAIAIMMTIYPLMGERRRAKIRSIITQWQNTNPPSEPPFRDPLGRFVSPTLNLFKPSQS